MAVAAEYSASLIMIPVCHSDPGHFVEITTALRNRTGIVVS